ncbi:hypothetical protein HB662_18505 [Roseomonas frigidaquae]|uniref:DUF2339 domain-containing protein n=1 Tax=Falsiroseomonas frigidaquae TaxID=487318 RepID=A0ABX1F366_9PROT|nr:hypothetical protein [Falsiroseomonas frigidaquae]NKE46779.1 hypothetical protein [Falsiroseomonas frigidaquae]
MLQDIVTALTLPGLPDWSGLVVLVLLALVGLAYLLMPFSVFGLKGRLEAVEAQLDEIQAEIRSLAQRMPEPTRRRPPVEEDWAEPAPAYRAASDGAPPRLHPPIIPPAAWPERGPGRSEPRLDWPRQPR